MSEKTKQIETELNICFRLTKDDVREGLARAIKSRDTIFGIESPRWVLNTFGQGCYGEHMLPYHPDVDKFVHPEELRDRSDKKLYYALDSIDFEIMCPSLNKAFAIAVVKNTKTGSYNRRWYGKEYKDNKYFGGSMIPQKLVSCSTFLGDKLELDGNKGYEIVDREDELKTRLLIPFFEGIGEQHNTFLTENEQKRLGTYGYYKEKEKLRELSEKYVQQWLDKNREERRRQIEKEIKEGTINPSSLEDKESFISSMLNAYPIQISLSAYKKAEKELGPEIVRKAGYEPVRLDPTINLLDNSKTYVSLMKEAHYSLIKRLYFYVTRDQINWREIVKESTTDTKFMKRVTGPGYLDFCIADVVSNNSTNGKMDLTLKAIWEKKY